MALIHKNYKVVNEDFYNTLSKENRVLDSYQQLCFAHNQIDIFTSDTHQNHSKNTVNVALFPSYMTPTFFDNNDLTILKIPQKKINGYAILIKEHTNLETLFKVEFKKSFRANILRFVKRFESCFNANYKLFFGDISETDYIFLMKTLNGMLTNRFNQRNDSNKILENWDQYLETSYTLIKEKKASLFVIYHNNVPVHISLNHHFNKILFVSVPSYDIDYAKFALGNISLYKLLEWSVENNYQIMDLAYGDLEYKRRWSNLIYTFDHHIIYSKKNSLSHIMGFYEIKKLNFKNYLKSKNIDDLADKIKKRLRKSKPFQEAYRYSFEDIQMPDTTHLEKINEQSTSFEHIKKPINDFLYINKEHINDLNIFEISEKREYVVVGKTTIQKLVLKF